MTTAAAISALAAADALDLVKGRIAAIYAEAPTVPMPCPIMGSRMQKDVTTSADELRDLETARHKLGEECRKYATGRWASYWNARAEAV